MDHIWTKILCPTWSFIVNLVFWIFHLHRLKLALDNKKQLALTVKDINSIKGIMNKFMWREDKFKDWRPWIITLIANNYEDDCDGAAELAKFLFEQIGISGNILSLKGVRKGHAIFVSRDKKYMISNSRVLEGNWDDEQIIKYFKVYHKIIIR